MGWHDGRQASSILEAGEQLTPGIRWAAALLGAATLLLAACATPPSQQAAPSAGTTAKAPPAGSAAPLVKVKISNPGRTINTSYIFAAQHYGAFAQRGLEVEESTMASGPALAALQTGELDLVGAVGSAAKAAMRGLPVRIVFVSGDRPSWMILGAKNITSIEQLRGKIIATSTPDTASSATFVELMRRRGIQPGEYQTVNESGELARAAALENGTVSAAVLEPTSALKLIREGFPRLTTVGDEIQMPFGGLVGYEPTVQSRRDVLRRAMSAMIDGLQIMRADKDKALPVLVQQLGLSQADASQLFDSSQSSWTTNGRPSQEAMQFELTNDQRDLKLSTPIKAEQVYDFSLLDGG